MYESPLQFKQTTWNGMCDVLDDCFATTCTYGATTRPPKLVCVRHGACGHPAKRDSGREAVVEHM